MKIEMGKQYQTRNGLAAEILTTGMRAGDYSVVALITLLSGQQVVQTYTANGAVWAGGLSVNHSDLIEVKPTHTRWLIVWPTSGYHNEKDALRSARTYPRNDFAIKEVTFTEGEGLEDA